jgi:hypothetical protein
MDFPANATPANPRPWRGAAVAAALLALAIYSVVLALNVGAVAGGSDSSGYMNGARLMAEGKVHVQAREIEGLPAADMPPFLYVPLGFKPSWNGDGIVPTYPTGFSLLVLALRPLAGWGHAGDAAVVLHALLGIVATFALARWFGLTPAWSALAAGMVGLSPLYLFMALQAMSDVPSLAWSTLAVYCALRSRERPSWAIAAGFAVAGAVLLRPTNVLLAAALLPAIGLSPRRWLLLVLGGLPGAVYFCAHSLAAYGRLVATGYSGDEEAFHASYIGETLVHYGSWLPVLLTPLVVLALAIPWIRTGRKGASAVLVAWILAYAGFYAAYKNTHEAWWYLRFLLPAVPAMAIAALLVLTKALARWPGVARSPIPCAMAAAMVVASSLAWGKDLNVLNVGQEQHEYGRVAEWMRRNAPPNAVCLALQASGALFYYTDFTFVRWDVLTKENVGRLDAAIRSARRPLYAVLFPFEINDGGALTSRMPGHWTIVGHVDQVTILRREFGPGKPPGAR